RRLCLFSRLLLDAPYNTYNYTLSLHDALPIFSDGIENQAMLNFLRESLVHQHHLLKDYPLDFLFEDYAYGVDKEEALEQLKEDRSEEHTSELQSRENLVCRLLLEKKNNKTKDT